MKLLDPWSWIKGQKFYLAQQWPKLDLLVLLVQRELVARYQGSILGNLWPLLNQLSQLLVYIYVFSIVLKVKADIGGSQSDHPFTFGLWLFAGLVPWLAFSSGLSMACISVQSQPNLVKKVVFPLSLLPLVPIGVAFLESTFGMLLLLVFVAFTIKQIHLSLFWLPLAWGVQLLLAAGLGYWLSGLAVFLRDIPQIVGVGLNLWFYATPIIYPLDMIPEPFAKWVLWLNPMVGIVEMYRDTILVGQINHWQEIGLSYFIAALIFWSGIWAYRKLKPGFADVL